MEFNLSLAATVINYALVAVGSASLIVQGIARITAVTPTTRDDEIVGSIQTGLRWVQSTWAGVTPLLNLGRDDFILTGVRGVFGPQMAEYVLGYLLLRRLADSKVKYISLPTDYFALYLLLGIAITGLLMRHLEKVDIVNVKAAIAGWASFQLVAPEGVGALYFIHVFLVSVLLVYFPFSKLLHAPGVFLSPTRNLANNNRAKRHVNPWNPPIVGHTYAEWEEEFHDKLVASGFVLDKE